MAIKYNPKEFAKKLQDRQFSEIHLYYSPMDSYVIKPHLVNSVMVHEKGPDSILHVDSVAWVLDIPLSLIGTVVWRKKHEHNRWNTPLARCVGDHSFREVRVTLQDGKTVSIDTDSVLEIDEGKMSVRVMLENGNVHEIFINHVSHVEGISWEEQQGTGPNALVNKARRLQEKNDIAGAIDLYDQAIELDPENARAWFYLGIARRMNDELPQAINAFREVMRLDPGNPIPEFQLGRCLRAAGKVEEAIEHLKRVIKVDPSMAIARIELGIAFRQVGELQRAIKEFRQAAELVPDDTEIWFQMGYTLYKSNDLDGAIEAYERAIALDPTHLPSLSKLGCAWCRTGDLEKSIETFEKAIRVDPESVDLLLDYTCALRRSGNLDVAERKARKAVELAPRNPLAWGALASVLRVQHRLDEARKAIHEELDLNDSSDLAWTEVALIEFEAGNRKEAERAIKKALSISESSNTLYNVACAYAIAGEPDKALDFLERSLEKDPTQQGMLLDDKDLESLRDMERFKQLAAKTAD
ncbi:tetratricopeptide repeat protein [Candidatus Bathyarchaeota archaeon]|nr:tetratricopeptide repeat protein [Candidatus Bathyarchaeota archaeon]